MPRTARQHPTGTRTQAAHTPAAPGHARVLPVLPDAPPAPDWPTWGQRLMPKHVRHMLADLGMWNDPTPQPPSLHLLQTLNVMRRYGRVQSVDFSPTGRLCIRGAQSLLEKTGHVTPANRARAEQYMQAALRHEGVDLPFFHWHDLESTSDQAVGALLTTSSYRARANGE